MSLNVIIPKDRAKIEKQIKALEQQIKRDTNQKDKEIHQAALNSLRNALSRE